MYGIAHRGFADAYPENTLHAFTAAADHITSSSPPEVAAIELDVRRCGSGELVVFHDETVDRVTDTSGVLADFTYDDLKSLTIHTSDEHIPTLEDVLETLPSHIPLQIELKEDGLATDVLQLVDGRQDATHLTTFRPSVLSEVRAENDEIDLGFAFRTDVDTSISAATHYDCTSIHPHQPLCRRTDVVEAGHDHTFEVIAWGVSTAIQAKQAAATGVDGFTADHWNLVPSSD